MKGFRAGVSILAITLTGLLGTAKGFDPEPWLRDFTQLEGMLSEAYGNLDTQVLTDGLSPKRLDAETRTALGNARSDAEAFRALKGFLARFRDGHLGLEPPVPSPASSGNPHPALARSVDPRTACAALLETGGKRRSLGFEFPVSAADGFERARVEDHAFSWTILDEGVRKIGFVRIASFRQADYPETCADAWQAYTRSIPPVCGRACQDQFVNVILPNRLIVAFDRVLEALEARGVSAVVLDLSGNGGGTNWVGAIMRMLVRRPIRCGTFGFIRHPHWVRKLGDERSRVAADLAKLRGRSGPERERLEKKLARLTGEIGEASRTCDRSGIWAQATYEPPCELVVKRAESGCSPSTELSYRPGVYGGPVFVLVDHRTASASEDLVSRYKDSGLATIVGERTLGSGCGFTDGGIDFRLANSGLKVAIPDCVRFAADGENEVRGIRPDVELPMASPKTRGLVARLKKILAADDTRR